MLSCQRCPVESGDDVCCSVMFGILVSVMRPELLMTSAIVLCGQCTSAREWSVVCL